MKNDEKKRSTEFWKHIFRKIKHFKTTWLREQLLNIVIVSPSFVYSYKSWIIPKHLNTWRISYSSFTPVSKWVTNPGITGLTQSLPNWMNGELGAIGHDQNLRSLSPGRLVAVRCMAEGACPKRRFTHVGGIWWHYLPPQKIEPCFLVELSHQSCNRREALIGFFSRGPQYENARDEMFYLFWNPYNPNIYIPS